MNKNLYKMVLVVILLLSFYYILFWKINETFEFEKISTKRIDNTNIKLINHFWTSDFDKRFQSHEPLTNLKMKELIKYLPNNTYIIDVGAHVGDTGLYLAQILKTIYPEKNIKVIMIDPDITKIDFIRKMAIKNNFNNVILKKFAVGKENKKGLIDKSHHPGGWTIEKNSNGNIIIDRIDKICKNMDISLLHIDVEGMEYDCLLGSKDILKNVKYIVIELNHIVNRSKESEFLKNNNFIEIKDNKINSRKENMNFLFKKI